MATKPNALLYYGPCNLLIPSPEEREDLIQRRAYFKALERSFAPGHELDDWLDAEVEVDEWLTRPRKGFAGARAEDLDRRAVDWANPAQ